MEKIIAHPCIRSLIHPSQSHLNLSAAHFHFHHGNQISLKMKQCYSFYLSRLKNAWLIGVYQLQALKMARKEGTSVRYYSNSHSVDGCTYSQRIKVTFILLSTLPTLCIVFMNASTHYAIQLEKVANYNIFGPPTFTNQRCTLIIQMPTFVVQRKGGKPYLQRQTQHKTRKKLRFCF